MFAQGKELIHNWMKKVASYLGLLADNLAGWGGIVAGLGILSLTGIMVFGTLVRYVFNRPNIFVDEISAYLLVMVTFMGLAYTAKVGGHVSVTVFTGRLPAKIGRRLQLATGVLRLIFIAVLLWGASVTVWNAYKLGTVSFTPLEVPLVVPQIVMPIGLAICLIYVIARINRP